MAIRAATAKDGNPFGVITLVLGDPYECDYCGDDFTEGYANACITVCNKCASRRRLPVVMAATPSDTERTGKGSSDAE